MSKSQNLIALVTGANRGIGLETSRQLAQRGVTVLMGGRDEASLHRVVKPLKDQGLDVIPVSLDVRDAGQIEALRKRIESDYGRLDILINNAGIITGESFFSHSAETISREALRETFEVNTIAPIFLTQTMLSLLKAAPAARVVNVSSIVGSIAIQRDFASDFKDVKPIGYDTSKAALNMATVHFAALLMNTPIKVNAAHPGWVKTDMGTDAAPMELVDGAKTSVELAFLGPDGPTGKLIHLGNELPW